MYITLHLSGGPSNFENMSMISLQLLTLIVDRRENRQTDRQRQSETGVTTGTEREKEMEYIRESGNGISRHPGCYEAD